HFSRGFAGTANACKLVEGASCQPGATPPACCGQGRTCGARATASGTTVAVCCRGLGGVCTGDTGCCSNLLCVQGKCRDPVSCGGLLQMCCANGVCATGLSCSAAGVCVQPPSCGGGGQACCTDPTVTPCQLGLSCQGGTCQKPCGMLDQPCCPSGLVPCGQGL